MASTILRFRNPNVFQIIDERAFRIAYGPKASYPKKFGKASKDYVKRSIDIYFDYLHRLQAIAELCRSDYSFMDRALYVLDKGQNKLRRSKR